LAVWHRRYDACSSSVFVHPERAQTVTGIEPGGPGGRVFRRTGAVLAAIAVIAGAAGIYGARRPERTPAMRGEVSARQRGCLSCHGPGGRGGVNDPGLEGGSIPGWEIHDTQVYVATDRDIREWILFGEPRTGPMASRTPRTDGLIPMPAYEHVLSPGELDDLMAYFRAVSGWAPSVPEAAYEGRVIADRHGCFGCHGPSGMGGGGNPGSLKNHIPAWDGEEFAELVRDEAELREWILDGRPRRLADDWLARRFLDRQLIQMPAYRALLSDDDVTKLVAYVAWLRNP